MKNILLVTILLFGISISIRGQSFNLKDGDKIYSCAHVINKNTGEIDAFPCSSIKLIIKREVTNEFIIINNNDTEAHYSIKSTANIDNILHYQTLSDQSIKTIFTILEGDEGVMHYIDISFYSESKENPYSYKMRVFNYSVYDSKETERIKNLESQTYDLRKIDEKTWYKKLSDLQYSFFGYFEFHGGPKFDAKDKTKDYIFIDNIYQIKVTGDYQRESIKTTTNLLKGEELPGIKNKSFISEIPYVKLEDGTGVYPEINFPEVPVQYVQGVTILKINWAKDIVEIVKRPPPTGLGIEKNLIEKIKADHKSGTSLPIGNVTILYTYINVLGQFKITYK